MKILLFSDQFWPETNAPAIHVHERARLWAASGHQVTVITSAPNFPEGRLFAGYRNQWRSVESVDGIRVVRVKTYIAANQGKARRILDYLSFMGSAGLFGCWEERPDVILSTSPQLFTAVAGVLQAAFHRVPHLFELRDLWPASIVALDAVQPGIGIRLLEQLELGLYRRSARVLAFTQAFRKDLVRRGIEGSKIEVVPNGVDLEVFKPLPKDEALAREIGLPPGAMVLAYFGTLGLAHGLETVLQAMALVREEPVHLLLAGSGAERDLIEARIGTLGLTNVTLLPRQPRDRMPSLWSLADLAVVSLKNLEVFRTVVPSKIYEAVGMGCPILFSGPAGEASALIDGGGFGVCVPPASPSLLGAAIQDLCRDRARMGGLGVRAVAARKAFDRRVQARRGLDLLEQTVASARD